MDIINKRRSVRKFKDQQVPREKIELMLRAAMQAPSAGNQQPWEFIVVTKQEILDKLGDLSPYAKPIKSAPAAIVVLGNEKYLKYPENMEQDLGAATENMLLEAVNQGLGTTWLGIHPLQERIHYVGQVLELQDYLKPYCAVPVGYPLQEDANKFIDRYDSHRVHYDGYSEQ